MWPVCVHSLLILVFFILFLYIFECLCMILLYLNSFNIFVFVFIASFLILIVCASLLVFYFYYLLFLYTKCDIFCAIVFAFFSTDLMPHHICIYFFATSLRCHMSSICNIFWPLYQMSNVTSFYRRN